MNEYVDKYGKPVTLEEWATLLEDRAYAIIKQDKLNGAEVSTVWMGLNYQLGDGPPLYFETMIFNHQNNTRGESFFTHRYSTLQEAEEGYELMLEKIRSGELSFDKKK